METLTNILKRIRLTVQNRHESAVLELEALYREFRQQPNLSFTDLLRATRMHNRIALRTPELYLVVAGVMFLLITTGSFAMQGDWTECTRHIFISTILVLAFFIPLGLNYIFMPLHLGWKLSLHTVTGALLVISAVLITVLAPRLTEIVTGAEISASMGVFVPVFGVLMFGGALLLVRNYDRVCFHCFNRRYPVVSLKSALPKEKRGALEAMEAQDHYVLFITQKGEHLHRTTLTAAINMAPANSGLRVHRSHWVAKSQIVDLVREQQKHIVILRNGRRVPVTKAKVEAVRALL